MNRLFRFLLKLMLQRLQYATDGPFDPELSYQIDCLQYLIETNQGGRQNE